VCLDSALAVSIITDKANSSKDPVRRHSQVRYSICIKDLCRIFIDGQFDVLLSRDDEGADHIAAD
jgi:hypothetical protein